MFAAPILTENETEIIVALFVLLGAIGAAWVPVQRTRRAAESAKDTLGEKPEDDVTVISLLETVVSGQADLVGRVAGHDGTLAEHAEKLVEHAEKLVEHDRLHDEHIARLEQHAEILRQLRGETH